MNLKRDQESGRKVASKIHNTSIRPGMNVGTPMRSASALTIAILAAVLVTVVVVLVAIPLQKQKATINGSVLSIDDGQVTIDTANSIETIQIDEDTVYPSALDPLDSVVVDYYERAGQKTATRITVDLDSDDELEPAISTGVDYPDSSG